MATYLGAPADDGISEHNKCWIAQGGVQVCGYLSEEAQVSFRSVWQAPFEGDSVGSLAPKLSAMGQSATDRTSISLLNTQKVFEGMESPEITLTLKFVAYTDAKAEVNDPIKALVQMASPELNEALPFGRIPGKCTVKVGLLNMPEVVILSDVSYDANAPKTKDGYFAYNTVTVTCTLEQAINKSQVPNYIR